MIKKYLAAARLQIEIVKKYRCDIRSGTCGEPYLKLAEDHLSEAERQLFLAKECLGHKS